MYRFQKHATLLVAAAASIFVCRAAPAATNFFRLAQHSFDQTLTYDSGLVKWLTSASAMALRDRVQIMPPVPDRHGLFWSKKAVKTKDFEFRFSFVAVASPPSDGTFALWISPDDFAASYDEQKIVTTPGKNWTEGMEAIGLTFLGNRPNFKGLGVFFLASDADSNSRESVVGMWSDGTQTPTLDNLRRGKVVGSQTKETSWLNAEMMMKVRVSSNGPTIVSMVKKADYKEDKDNYVEMFSLKAGSPAPEDCFVGFSGWSGSKAYIQLDITSVETRNYDSSVSGEDSTELLDVNAAEWAKVLEGEKRYVTQASQMQAVNRLTKLLSDHVDRYTTLGNTLKGSVTRMEGRLDALGADFGKLFTETEAFDFKSNSFSTDAIRDHIKGIHTILSHTKAHHETKMSEVKDVATDLKETGSSLGEEGKLKVQEVAEQAKAVEELRSRGMSQNNVMLILMVLSVCGLGVLFINRMQYHEKKNYHMI